MKPAGARSQEPSPGRDAKEHLLNRIKRVVNNILLTRQGEISRINLAVTEVTDGGTLSVPADYGRR